MAQRTVKANRVLVVDDEPGVRSVLSEMLRTGGFTTESVPEGRDALRALRTGQFDVLITDVRLPDISGMELLSIVRDKYPWLPVIVVTGYASIDSTIKAMRLGAVDYIPKPFTRDSVLSSVELALQTGLSTMRSAEKNYGEIVHTGRAMREVLDLVEKVSRSDSTVLVTGESGTGKELIARAIHRKGPRARQPFVTVNSGALPEGLLESELFGHTRGAFTGAVSSTLGRFRIADGGSLFLDEVGNMSPAMQVKLLRVIQEKEFSPVGSSEMVKVDVRLVTATNRNLEEAVRLGEFREDLFYRLNVIEIRLPSLRERTEDILPLARHFLDRFAESRGQDAWVLDDQTAALLLSYPWPGNVRELENTMERASVLCESGIITPADLPERIRRPSVLSPAPSPPAEGVPLPRLLENIERQHIEEALRRCGGVRSRAAEYLGMKRTTLLARMGSLGMTGRGAGG